MKLTRFAILAAFALVLPVVAHADMGVQYELTITNGSQMPISPAAIYVKNGEDGSIHIGQMPSAAFTQLCQTGDPSGRLNEASAESGTTFTTTVPGPILPGDSRTVTVTVQNPSLQSLHFEAMYGKSKDVCGVGTINSHTLYALAQHITPAYIGKDEVYDAGAFTAPMLPMDANLQKLCMNAADAVSCLRQLTMTNPSPRVHFFTQYLPSLIGFLESRYGASKTQTLLIPDSGAIRFKLEVK